ncbi:MAG: hypothetical protein BJ554DRAFT_6080 [Olpidium bornovanus]|uniref:Uncharacterized protein n=1 Tax=Olpidium bornovanus TaxID=278681 RepID=A0A8H7ZYH5_9FUNG|nr:MAG: hypothetical protein BJ554DRAFT_6080 [Olpidium bornovanus]
MPTEMEDQVSSAFAGCQGLHFGVPRRCSGGASARPAGGFPRAETSFAFRRMTYELKF